MKLQSIEERWRIFELELALRNYNRSQRDLSKKAFYAGCFMTLLEFEKVGNEEVSEEEAFNHMNNLKDECLAFAGIKD